MVSAITFILLFALSWLGTSVFIRLGARAKLLDVPNERSSHKEPTPVGGGVVFVILSLACLIAFNLYLKGALTAWPIIVAAVVIASISWFDDLKPIPSGIRLAVHVAAAGIVVFQFGYIRVLEVLPGIPFDLGPAGLPLTILGIVWMTNAYNFMDGIDGIAGLQAFIASAGWMIMGYAFGLPLVMFTSLAVCAGTAGFLVHNWAPARVFMGDVGSAFLGFLFSAMILLGLTESKNEELSAYLPVAGIAFVWMFAADSVLTFLRRLFRWEPVWSAHRKHLYQELIKTGLTHQRVTLIYGVLAILVAASAIVEAKTGIRFLFPGIAFGAVVFIVISVLRARTRRI